jgi:hypothetical protein
MKTHTIIARGDRHTITGDYVRPNRITLPLPSFAIPPQDRDETAPTAATIRGDAKWQRDKLLAMAARVKA